MPEDSERLDDIEAAIDQIIDLLTTKKGGPWTWHLLDRDKQELLWEELLAFVEWLEERYLVNLSRQKLPFSACWYKHPVAVELLTALMVAHKSVYALAKTVPSTGLADWHERYLWPTFSTIDRLQVFKDCDGPAGHTDPARSPVTTDRVAFDKYVISTLPVDADEATGEI